MTPIRKNATVNTRPFYSKSAFARRTSLSRPTVRRLVRTGVPRFKVIGRQEMIPAVVAQHYLRKAGRS